MWSENLNELEKIVLLKEVKGRKLKITIYPKKLEEMNWSWNSLNFLYNEDEFAIVEDIESYEHLTLTTDGDTEVYTINEDEKITGILKFEDIESLVKTREIYDENKYLIEDKNHFSLHFCKVFNGAMIKLEPACNQKASEKVHEYETVDVSDFQANPKTIDELIELLEECFISQFGEKPHWIITDEYQRVKKLSNDKYLVLETTDLRNTFPGDKFSVTRMLVDINLYNIETEEFYNEYLAAYGYKSIKELRQKYLNTANQIIAEIISETDSYNEAVLRTHCEDEQEVLQHLEDLMKEYDSKNN